MARNEDHGDEALTDLQRDFSGAKLTVLVGSCRLQASLMPADSRTVVLCSQKLTCQWQTTVWMVSVINLWLRASLSRHTKSGAKNAGNDALYVLHLEDYYWHSNLRLGQLSVV